MNLKWLKIHSDEIIFGTCLAGIVGAGVLACVETPKAVAAAKEKETKLDKVKAAAPYYIAPVAITVLSATGMTAVLVHKNKQITGLGLALAGAEEAAFKYRKEVKALIGEKEEQKVQNQIAQKEVSEHPTPQNVVVTDSGKTVKIYDRYLGRYFYGNVEELKTGFLNAYSELMHCGPDEDSYISLNDLYRYIGEPLCKDDEHREVAADNVGWHSMDGLKASDFFPICSACLDDDGKPCYAYGFNVPPRVNYQYPPKRGYY